MTGVSGGGKSTLVIDTLYKAAARHLNGASEPPAPHERIDGLDEIDKVIDIDQSPIGRTPRSNPATYTGAFTPIRDWFAGLPEAKARGYLPGRFSFNVKGGRCEACQGDGVIKIEMHFLPDVYVTCDVCKGKRYDRETLEVRYKDKSIADVLDMTVEEAAELFKAVPSIRDKMETLKRVGLSYVKVGQQATTLSGGEAQRVKLAKELARRSTGRTLYILDEPTTGLHFHDVAQLLDVLHELVDQGNTMIVIEHNLEVVKTADWIVDMGPEGGDAGGEVVAEGHAGADRPQSEELHRPVSEACAGAEGEGRKTGGGVGATIPMGRTPNEGKCCDAVLHRIETKLGVTRSNVRSPESDRDPAARVELVCEIGGRSFALEHTRIEPFDGFFRLHGQAAWQVDPITHAVSSKVASGETWQLVMPLQALDELDSDKLCRVQAAIVEWILSNAPIMAIAPDAYYPRSLAWTYLPNVPVRFRLDRWMNATKEAVFQIGHAMEHGKLEPLRQKRIRRACTDRLGKLREWGRRGARTILILENNDMRSTNEALVFHALEVVSHEFEFWPDQIYEYWPIWLLWDGARDYYSLEDFGRMPNSFLRSQGS